MNNILKKTFGEEIRWINFRILKKDGKNTKIPFSPRTRMKASTVNPADWGTYDEAKKISQDVGIVFKEDKLLLGIDIDHCLEGEIISHEQKENIAQFIIEADTYTEISPSGTGLHLFLILTDPLTLVANKNAPYELYTDGRYFTTTNNPYKEEKEVRKVSATEAQALLAIIGYPWGKTKKKEVMEEKPPAFEDEHILTKMCKSKKNGVKVTKLYNGDISDYKDDASSADMALLSHLAYWTGKNASQMMRIWLASPLGQREKTQNRKDYVNRTIENAIKLCNKVYETSSMKIEKVGIDLLFIMTKDGDKIFTQNTENMCRILRHHPQFINTIRYDEFQNVYEIKYKDKWNTIENNDAVNTQTSIQILFPCFGKVDKGMVFDAMIKVAKENTIDSASDFIRSLVWDSTPRLDTWLHTVYGTPNDLLHEKIGSNWLKGLVKRIIHPGCKFDYVLVLEGEQGIKKSTSLAILGGDWHVETTMSTESKDFFMQFQGKAIIEFSEGETLSRTEVKRLKAIITMQKDKYRPPYERTSQDFPRRCVFAMTTNQTEYLKDETGNRRWLPVAVLKVADIEWLTLNRNQLLAEAYQRVVVDKETVWEFPEEDMLHAQQQRRIHDPNEELIAHWYLNKLTQRDRDDGITVFHAYRDALYGGMPSKAIDKFMEMSIADVFKNYLKIQKKRKMIDGFQAIRWFQDEHSMQSLAPDTIPETHLEKFVTQLKLQ